MGNKIRKSPNLPENNMTMRTKEKRKKERMKEKNPWKDFIGSTYFFFNWQGERWTCFVSMAMLINCLFLFCTHFERVQLNRSLFFIMSFHSDTCSVSSPNVVKREAHFVARVYSWEMLLVHMELPYKCLTSLSIALVWDFVCEQTRWCRPMGVTFFALFSSKKTPPDYHLIKFLTSDRILMGMWKVFRTGAKL